jgi:RNA polymerase sigma-70 factor (ECF subfamily)
MGLAVRKLETRVSAEERTDEVLMARLCQGHDWALAELVRRYQNDIYRFCLHYLREVESAREMAQETFLRVFTARNRFDAARKFRPWVLCIARNLCLNELKRKKTVSMETLEIYASAAREESGEVLRFSGNGPDETSMARERREALVRMLSTINEESREILTLRFFEKMSAKEIADVIGSTEGAVRTKLHRILSGLREQHAAQREQL